MPPSGSGLIGVGSDLGLDPVALLPVVAAALLYGAGARRMAAGGRAWPASRTTLFGVGLLAVLVATQGPLAAGADTRFSNHAGQHLLLGMVGPLLLALAAPMTLVLQAGGPAASARLRRLLHRRAARVLAHPLVGLVLFGGSLFALYFSPLLGLSLRNELVHAGVTSTSWPPGSSSCGPSWPSTRWPPGRPTPSGSWRCSSPCPCTPSWG